MSRKHVSVPWRACQPSQVYCVCPQGRQLGAQAAQRSGLVARLYRLQVLVLKDQEARLTTPALRLTGASAESLRDAQACEVAMQPAESADDSLRFDGLEQSWGAVMCVCPARSSRPVGAPASLALGRAPAAAAAPAPPPSGPPARASGSAPHAPAASGCPVVQVPHLSA